MDTAPFPTKNLVNGHPYRCQCRECYELIMERFAPFDCQPFSHRLLSAIKNCPDCKRPCSAFKRGSFLTWSCWECLHELAEITAPNDFKDFAFAQTLDDDGPSENLYLHMSRRWQVSTDGGDYPILIPIPKTAPKLILEKDQQIIFERLEGDRGLKAIWWALASELTTVIDAIQHRSLYRFVVRVGKEKISKLYPEPTFQYYWEGKNLALLRAAHPKHDWPCFGGIFDFKSRYFEKFDPKTQLWTPCDDPR